jgi:hypothetical protein
MLTILPAGDFMRSGSIALVTANIPKKFVLNVSLRVARSIWLGSDSSF